MTVAYTLASVLDRHDDFRGTGAGLGAFRPFLEAANP